METNEELFYKYCYFCNFIYQGFHRCPNIEEFNKLVQYIHFVEMSKIYKKDILKLEKDIKADKMTILTTTSTTSTSSSMSKSTDISQNNNNRIINNTTTTTNTATMNKKSFTLNTTTTEDVKIKNNFKIKSLEKELSRYDSNSICRKLKNTTSIGVDNNSKNIIKTSSSRTIGEKPVEPVTAAEVLVKALASTKKTDTVNVTAATNTNANTTDKKTLSLAVSENKNKSTTLRKCLKDNNETKVNSKYVNEEKYVNNNNGGRSGSKPSTCKEKIKIDKMESFVREEKVKEKESEGSGEIIIAAEENDGSNKVKEDSTSSGSKNCINNHNNDNSEKQFMENTRTMNYFQNCPYQNNFNTNNNYMPTSPSGFINNCTGYAQQYYRNNIPMQFPLPAVPTMRFQYNPFVNQVRQQQKHQHTHIQQHRQQQQQHIKQQSSPNQQKKQFNATPYAGISLQIPPPSIQIPPPPPIQQPPPAIQQTPPPLPPHIQHQPPPTFYYPNCYSNYEYYDYDQNGINDYNMMYNNNNGYYSGVWCHPPFLHNANNVVAAPTYHHNNNSKNNNHHKSTQSTSKENCYKTSTRYNNNATYKQASPSSDEDGSPISTDDSNTATNEINGDLKKVNEVKTNNTDAVGNNSTGENGIKTCSENISRENKNCEKLKTKSTTGESPSSSIFLSYSSQTAAATPKSAAAASSSAIPVSSSSASVTSAATSSSEAAEAARRTSSPSSRIYYGRTNNKSFGTTFYNNGVKDEITHFSTRYIIDTIVELKKDIAELQSCLGIVKE